MHFAGIIIIYQGMNSQPDIARYSSELFFICNYSRRKFCNSRILNAQFPVQCNKTFWSLFNFPARIKYHLYCISRKRKKTKKDQLGTIFSTSKNVGEIRQTSIKFHQHRLFYPANNFLRANFPFVLKIYFLPLNSFPLERFNYKSGSRIWVSKSRARGLDDRF